MIASEQLPIDSSLGFGLYTRQNKYRFDDIDAEWEDWGDNYACYEWTDSEQDLLFDSKWKAARVFGQIGSTIGVILMILTIVMACMSFSVIAVRVMAFASFVAGVCVFLTLLALASDICNEYDCEFSHGAGTSIGAGLAFMLTAIILAMTPAAVKIAATDDVPMFSPTQQNMATIVPNTTPQPPAGTVTVTETTLPDGSKKTTRITHNADGSKTVQETIGRPHTVQFFEELGEEDDADDADDSWVPVKVA